MSTPTPRLIGVEPYSPAWILAHLGQLCSAITVSSKEENGRRYVCKRTTSFRCFFHSFVYQSIHPSIHLFHPFIYSISLSPSSPLPPPSSSLPLILSSCLDDRSVSRGTRKDLLLFDTSFNLSFSKFGPVSPDCFLADQSAGMGDHVVTEPLVYQTIHVYYNMCMYVYIL